MTINICFRVAVASVVVWLTACVSTSTPSYPALMSEKISWHGNCQDFNGSYLNSGKEVDDGNKVLRRNERMLSHLLPVTDATMQIEPPTVVDIAIEDNAAVFRWKTPERTFQTEYPYDREMCKRGGELQLSIPAAHAEGVIGLERSTISVWKTVSGGIAVRAYYEIKGATFLVIPYYQTQADWYYFAPERRAQ